MTKSDFLDLLREKISRLPEWEAAKTVVYYSEMIDDRIEDGMSEEEAVAALGSIDGIVSEVCAGIGAESDGQAEPEDGEAAPQAQTEVLQETAEGKRAKRKLTPAKIAIVAVTSPVWIALAAAAAVTVIALYIAVLAVLWSAVVSLFAVTVSFLACGPAAGTVSGVRFFAGSAGAGLFYAGAGLFLEGLGLLLIRPALRFARLSAKISRWIFVKPAGIIGRIKK